MSANLKTVTSDLFKDIGAPQGGQQAGGADIHGTLKEKGAKGKSVINYLFNQGDRHDASGM